MSFYILSPSISFPFLLSLASLPTFHLLSICLWLSICPSPSPRTRRNLKHRRLHSPRSLSFFFTITSKLDIPLSRFFLFLTRSSPARQPPLSFNSDVSNGFIRRTLPSLHGHFPFLLPLSLPPPPDYCPLSLPFYYPFQRRQFTLSLVVTLLPSRPFFPFFPAPPPSVDFHSVSSTTLCLYWQHSSFLSHEHTARKIANASLFFFCQRCMVLRGALFFGRSFLEPPHGWTNTVPTRVNDDARVSCFGKMAERKRSWRYFWRGSQRRMKRFGCLLCTTSYFFVSIRTPAGLADNVRYSTPIAGRTINRSEFYACVGRPVWAEFFENTVLEVLESTKRRRMFPKI